MCLEPAEEEDDRKIDDAKELQITPCVLPAIAHPIQLSRKLDDLVNLQLTCMGLQNTSLTVRTCTIRALASQSQISKQPRCLKELYGTTVLSLMSVVQHAERPSTTVSTGL